MPAVGHPLSSLSRDKSGTEPSGKKHAREHANDDTEPGGKPEEGNRNGCDKTIIVRLVSPIPLWPSWHAVSLVYERKESAENQDCAGI